MSIKSRIRGLSDKNLGYFVFGETLIALSLGAMNSLKLIRHIDLILIAATILTVTYINSTLIRLKRKDDIPPFTLIIGYIAGFLLVFFFGIQSPQLPIKNIIFTGGLILTVPAAIEILRVKS
jgi:hypothetical protein